MTILQSNKVLLFGVETDLVQLLDAMKTASSNNGVLLYYRENDAQDTLTTSNQLIQMAIESQIAIRKSSKSDFSDLVYRNGNLKPK